MKKEYNTEEVTAKIRELGVNAVLVRPAGIGWAIFHPIDAYHAETLYSADSKEDCAALVRAAARAD